MQRRTNRAKPYKARKTAKKVATKAYVKQQISRNSEKKEFVHQSLSTSVDFVTVSSYNLNFHGVARGAGEIQFTGNGYKIKQMQVKFQLSNFCPALAFLKPMNSPLSFFVAIIKTKIYKTLTSLTKEELWDENLGLLDTQASLFRDSDKMKVLASKTVTIYPDPDPTRNSVQSKVVHLSCKPNTMFRYRDFDNSYEGQSGNYYAIIFPTKYGNLQTSPVPNNVRFDIYSRVTFTDS